MALPLELARGPWPGEEGQRIAPTSTRCRKAWSPQTWLLQLVVGVGREPCVQRSAYAVVAENRVEASAV